MYPDSTIGTRNTGDKNVTYKMSIANTEKYEYNTFKGTIYTDFKIDNTIHYINIKKLLKRYFITAMSYMALGLFSSLIVGLIISQIAKIPHLEILASFSGLISRESSSRRFI